MGAQCTQPIDSNLFGGQYNIIEEIEHPVFGLIFHLKNDSNGKEIGVKKIDLEDQKALFNYRRKIEIAKEYDHSIPTLVQIYDFEILDSKNKNKSNHHQFQKKSENAFRCLHDEVPIILMHFQYFNQECSFEQTLQRKMNDISKFNKTHKSMESEVKKVKLCEYAKIDKLSSFQRQYINLFYQEIQILRMIDHIVGAIYFLNHFEIQHCGIRPDNILVDEEGKYILIDRSLFRKKKNYQIALDLLNQEESRHTPKMYLETSYIEKISFLSPELMKPLRNKQLQPKRNSEKEDIFSVGLLALEMCLLEKNSNIFQYNTYSKSLTFLESQLTKKLYRAKQKYSEEFIRLLESMLQINPAQRISFTELIDELNPILTSNLERVRKIYSVNEAIRTESSVFVEERNSNIMIEDGQQSFGVSNDHLKTKLMKMEQMFQRIMCNRTVLNDAPINEQEIKREQQRILKRLAKLKANNMLISTIHIQNKKFNNEITKFRSNIPSNDNKSLFKNSKCDENIQNITNSKILTRKRQISGNELYQIYQNEYEQIRSSRPSNFN